MGSKSKAEQTVPRTATRVIFWALVVGGAGYFWFTENYRQPMTTQCAWLLDERPDGGHNDWPTEPIDEVTQCRIDQYRFHQERWHLRVCTPADLQYGKSHPNSALTCR